MDAMDKSDLFRERKDFVESILTKVEKKEPLEDDDINKLKELERWAGRMCDANKGEEYLHMANAFRNMYDGSVVLRTKENGDIIDNAAVLKNPDSTKSREIVIKSRENLQKERDQAVYDALKNGKADSETARYREEIKSEGKFLGMSSKKEVVKTVDEMSVKASRDGADKFTNELETSAVKVKVTQELGGKKFSIRRETEQKMGYTETKLNNQSGYFANEQTGEISEIAALAKDASVEMGAYKESTKLIIETGDWRIGVNTEIGVAAPNKDLFERIEKPQITKDGISGKIWSPFKNCAVKLEIGKKKK